MIFTINRQISTYKSASLRFAINKSHQNTRLTWQNFLLQRDFWYTKSLKSDLHSVYVHFLKKFT